MNIILTYYTRTQRHMYKCIHVHLYSRLTNRLKLCVVSMCPEIGKKKIVTAEKYTFLVNLKCV